MCAGAEAGWNVCPGRVFCESTRAPMFHGHGSGTSEPSVRGDLSAGPKASVYTRKQRHRRRQLPDRLQAAPLLFYQEWAANILLQPFIKHEGVSKTWKI